MPSIFDVIEPLPRRRQPRLNLFLPPFVLLYTASPPLRSSSYYQNREREPFGRFPLRPASPSSDPRMHRTHPTHSSTTVTSINSLISASHTTMPLQPNGPAWFIPTALCRAQGDWRPNPRIYWSIRSELDVHARLSPRVNLHDAAALGNTDRSQAPPLKSGRAGHLSEWLFRSDVLAFRYE